MPFLHHFAVTIPDRQSLLLILLYQSRVAFNICKENRGKLAICWHDLLVLIKFSDFSKYQSANRSAIIKPNCDN
jgi:hypothetical protein